MADNFENNINPELRSSKGYQTSLTTIGTILSANGIVLQNRNYPNIDNGSVAISKEWLEHPLHDEVVQILIDSYGTSDEEKIEYAERLNQLNFWDTNLSKHPKQTFSLLRKTLISRSNLEQAREELGWSTELNFSYKKEAKTIKRYLEVNQQNSTKLFEELSVFLTSTELPTREVFLQIRQSLENYNYVISQPYRDANDFYTSFLQALRSELLGKDVALEISQKRSNPRDVIRYNIKKRETLVKDMLYDEYNEEFFSLYDIEKFLDDVEKTVLIYTVEVNKRIQEAKKLIDEETGAKLTLLEANGKKFLVPLPFHIEDKQRINKNHPLFYYRKSFIEFYKELLSENINALISDKEVVITISNVIDMAKKEHAEEYWVERLEEVSASFALLLKNRYANVANNDEIIRIIRVYDKEYRVVNRQKVFAMAKNFVEFKDKAELLKTNQTHVDPTDILSAMEKDINQFLGGIENIDDIKVQLVERLKNLSWKKFKSSLRHLPEKIISLKILPDRKDSVNFYETEFVDSWLIGINSYLNGIIEREIESIRRNSEL